MTPLPPPPVHSTCPLATASKGPSGWGFDGCSLGTDGGQVYLQGLRRVLRGMGRGRESGLPCFLSLYKTELGVPGSGFSLSQTRRDWNSELFAASDQSFLIVVSGFLPLKPTGFPCLTRSAGLWLCWLLGF